MSNIKVLLMGEMQRMQKYNIFSASLLVAVLWMGVLYLTDLQDISTMFPLLIFIDATSMALLLIGVTMFFEKQEGTLKSLLVSPISKGEYILAKSSANITSNLLTLFLLYAYARIFKTLDVSLLAMLGAVILISLFHSLVGFYLTFGVRDFTHLLMAMMKYFFFLMLPVVLDFLGLIPGEIVEYLLYILPTKASMTILLAGAGIGETWEILFSTVYMIIITAILFSVVYRKFDDFAVRESGV